MAYFVDSLCYISGYMHVYTYMHAHDVSNYSRAF